MARPSKKSSVTQLTFDQLSLDMTSSTNPPSHSSGHPKDEGTSDSFVDVSAASQALAEASEALDELREYSAQVEAEGLDVGPMETPSIIGSPPEVQPVQVATEQPAPEVLLSQMLQQKNDEIKPAISGRQKVGEQLRAARIAGQYAIEDIAAEIKIK
ncbi:MAG: hypothetical protein K2Q32_04355, partial [Alphaproteobacteria bacterium]|nr:hypothetical protein [Alphaproteobacteria bacterium]